MNKERPEDPGRNLLFDAIEAYVGVRLELIEDRPRHTAELRSLLSRVTAAEAELRKVCARVYRVDGGDAGACGDGE